MDCLSTVTAFNSIQRLKKRRLNPTPNPSEIQEPSAEIARRNVHLSRLSKEIFGTDAVVNRIMNNMERDDMKTFRKVNRLCYKKAKWLWLRNRWIRTRDNNLANILPLHELDHFFKQLFSREVPFPAVSFTLSLTELPICTSESEETLDELGGNQIISLEFEAPSLQLQLSVKNGIEENSEMISLLIENAETLHLKVTGEEDDPDDIEAPSVLFTVFSKGLINLRCLKMEVETSINFDFLTKFPALKEIFLTGRQDTHIPWDFSSLFAELYRIRRLIKPGDPEILNLKTLDMIGVPTSSLQYLPMANLSLEHLALRLHKNVTETLLAQILDQYAPTLKSLKLLKYKLCSHVPFTKIPLTETFFDLKEVELWGNVVTNFNFVKSFPKIVKLKMDFCCFECPYFSGDETDDPAVYQGDLVLNSFNLRQTWKFCLKHMQEFATDCILPCDSWGTLATWMPSLQVLEAPMADSATLLYICDDFTKLEKLRIRFGSDINDDGLAYGRVNYLDGRISYAQGVQKLKNLHTFVLEAECGTGKITDKSAHLCFLKLPKLTTLKLGFTRMYLTDEIEGRLRDTIKHVELYRSCSRSRKGGKIEDCCLWHDFKLDWNLD